MIRVRYDRRGLALTVEGHAGAAPKGQDLVCAAASALAQTAAACAEDGADRFFPAVCRSEGRLRVACRAPKRHAAACRRMLDTVFTGFELLSSQYPDHVRAIKENEDGN